MWYLIVPIPDLCTLTYFVQPTKTGNRPDMTDKIVNRVVKHPNTKINKLDKNIIVHFHAFYFLNNISYSNNNNLRNNAIDV